MTLLLKWDSYSQWYPVLRWGITHLSIHIAFGISMHCSTRRLRQNAHTQEAWSKTVSSHRRDTTLYTVEKKARQDSSIPSRESGSDTRVKCTNISFSKIPNFRNGCSTLYDNASISGITDVSISFLAFRKSNKIIADVVWSRKGCNKVICICPVETQSFN